MKVAFVHYLKHHGYYSCEGIIKSGVNVTVFLGYYNNNDFIDRILLMTSKKTLVEGYRYEKISPYVKTNIWIKALFLLSKKWPKCFENVYVREFQKWVIKCIHRDGDYDCIHVLQDYCSDVIDYAYKSGMKIVYEQIIALNPSQFYENDKTQSNRESKDKLNKELENLNKSNYVIMASEFVKDSILNYANSELIKNKFVVIPYGVDIKRFSRKHRDFYDGHRNLRVLTVASMSYRKGIFLLIEAMRLMDNLPVELTLIGGGGR